LVPTKRALRAGDPLPPVPSRFLFLDSGRFVRRPEALLLEFGAQLLAQGIEDETVHRYLVWRRSLFLLVAVVTFCSALLHVIATFTRDYTGSSTFGILTQQVRLRHQTRT
jgi:hypothetical protein